MISRRMTARKDAIGVFDTDVVSCEVETVLIVEDIEREMERMCWPDELTLRGDIAGAIVSRVGGVNLFRQWSSPMSDGFSCACRFVSPLLCFFVDVFCSLAGAQLDGQLCGILRGWCWQCRDQLRLTGK